MKYQKKLSLSVYFIVFYRSSKMGLEVKSWKIFFIHTVSLS